MRKLFAFFIILSSSNVFAWGDIGHRVVGELAQKRLSPQAKQMIKDLIGRESLATASVWPDVMKSNKKFDHFRAWHYANLMSGKTYLESPLSKKGDIVRGILLFEDALRNKAATPKQKRIALRYLVHLVGDIHQPLHLGNKSDLGGNKIHIKWSQRNSNLHRVWDTDMIELQKLSYTEYTQELENFFKDNPIKMQQGTVLDWATESRSYFKKTYNFKQRKKYWEYNYVYAHKSFMNKRLYMGGIRLATLLNKIAAKENFSDDELKLRKKLNITKTNILFEINRCFD